VRESDEFLDADAAEADRRQARTAVLISGAATAAVLLASLLLVLGSL